MNNENFFKGLADLFIGIDKAWEQRKREEKGEQTPISNRSYECKTYEDGKLVNREVKVWENGKLVKNETYSTDNTKKLDTTNKECTCACENKCTKNENELRKCCEKSLSELEKEYTEKLQLINNEVDVLKLKLEESLSLNDELLKEVDLLSKKLSEREEEIESKNRAIDSVKQVLKMVHSNI